MGGLADIFIEPSHSVPAMPIAGTDTGSDGDVELIDASSRYSPMSNDQGFPADFTIHQASREIIRQCAATYGKTLEELKATIKESPYKTSPWIAGVVAKAVKRGVTTRSIEIILGVPYHRARRWLMSGHAYDEPCRTTSHADSSAMPC